MQEDLGDFAAVVLGITLDDKIPVVRDPEKKDPPLYKYPGGTRKKKQKGEIRRETPEQCARREYFEETGIDLDVVHPDPLPLIEKEKREGPGPKHMFYVFFADLRVYSNMLTLASRGQEGEEIGLFTPAQILGSQDFLRGQKRLTRNKLNELNWRNCAA